MTGARQIAADVTLALVVMASVALTIAIFIGFPVLILTYDSGGTWWTATLIAALILGAVAGARMYSRIRPSRTAKVLDATR